MSDITNRQRALWTFLITSLAAPFLGALIVMLISVVAGALGKGPDSLRALDGAGQIAWAAGKAVATFAWAAIPAVVGAAGLAGLVFLRGTFGPLEAIVAGVGVAIVGSIISGGMVLQHVWAIAIIAALVALAISAMLRRGGIIQ